MEYKIRYLEMIQSIINRMAANSFALKGWAVSLVAGIFALSSNDADKTYYLVAYVPIIIFWGLDSYYLLQERLYRSLYNYARKIDEDNIDFSLAATEAQFGSEKNDYCSCICSPTELWFYLPLALVSTIIALVSSI